MGIYAGRFSGYVFGLTAAVLLSYYALSPSFYPLVSWLAPSFGGGIALGLGMFYMLAANPLTYPVLFPVWIAVGAVIGASVRKVSSSILISTLVSFSLLALMLSVWLGIFASFVSPLIQSAGTGSLGSAIPAFHPELPPPPTNLLSIIQEPVISQIFSYLSNVLSSSIAGHSSSGAAANPANVLTGLFILLFLGAIVKLLVCALTASLVAYFLKRQISGMKGRKRSAQLKSVAVLFLVSALIVSSLIPLGAAHSTSDQKYVPGNGEVAVLAYRTLPSLLHFQWEYSSHLSPCNMGTAYHSASAADTSHYYSESSENLISPYGTLYSFYSFASNQSIPQGSSTGNGQVAYSMLMLSSGMENLFSTGLFSDILHVSGGGQGTSAITDSATLIGLIPPELLLVGVNAGAMPVEKVAGAQATYYSSISGAHLALLASLQNTSINISGASGIPFSSNLFIYGAALNPMTAAANIASAYAPFLHPDGMILSFEQQLESGNFFSPPVHGFAGSLITVGYEGNGTYFSPVPGAPSSITPSFPSRGPFSFLEGLTVKTGFASGGGMHSISMSSLIGNVSFSFSNSSTTSYLDIFTPDTWNAFSIQSLSADYNLTVFTTSMPSVANASPRVHFVNASSGYIFRPDAMFNFSSPLIPDIYMTATAAVSGSNLFVSGTTVNAGNTSAVDVSAYFPGIASLSGNSSPFYRNVSALPPGQSFSFSFTVPFSGMGIYVLSGLDLHFISGGHAYTVPYRPLLVEVSQIPLFSVFPQSVGNALYAISLILRSGIGTALSEIIAYVAITLLMALAILQQFLEFRKWRMA